jgi:hypothetical protein
LRDVLALPVVQGTTNCESNLREGNTRGRISGGGHLLWRPWLP